MRSSTLFLQVVIVLIGIGTLALLLWQPHLEGRNAHATLFQIYFNDPFLAYAYIASISFFVALYQAFKVLGYVRQNKIFSQATVNSLRTIKYCAIAIIGFVVAALAYLFIARPGDDIAGGVFMGILITFASIVIATAAAMFERILQNAVDIKSENDLTV
jgi:cytochrome bd-type quinol oxidase subunit 2